MIEIIKAKDAPPAPMQAINRTRWPWKEMDVGDMVAVTDPLKFNSCNVTLSQHAKAYGKKFTTRQINGVLHVWRVE